ncbi:NADH:flavin oxidoreductase [bacterium]|nr:NADH:flavin oxidoreductase [bacterium]
MNITDRIVRSASIENMADENGTVNIDTLSRLYKNISARIIITGFTAVSENGRAMQKLQAGIYNDTQENAWKELVEKLKKETPDKQLIIQLAHTGRQTTRANAVGASNKICTYFRNIVKPLTTEEAEAVINDFAYAALRAQRAGFDGCQVHAAHGYLIHQFLSKHTNNRNDIYEDGTLFLEKILKKIRYACGDNFQIWIKVSAEDDTGWDVQSTIETLIRVEKYLDNIEVSYGTMEYALNIIRGGFPADIVFKVNPLFNSFPQIIKYLAKLLLIPRYKKIFKPFTYNYNLEFAKEIKKNVKTSITVVGGIRKLDDIEMILNSGMDYVSMSRPFICEPDLVNKIKCGQWSESKCTNCNLCTIYCDSENPIHCYVYN